MCGDDMSGLQQKQETDGRENDAFTNLNCPDCESSVSKTSDNQEYVCEECGLVISEDRIDHGPDWYGDDSRVGAPTTNTIHDRGLSTNIGRNDKDSKGNTLSNRKRKQINRLRKREKWFKTQSQKEQTLRKSLSEISRITSALGLPDVVNETASVIFRRYHKEHGIERSIEEVTAACVYAASKQCSFPRTLDDIRPVCRKVMDGQATEDQNSGIPRTYHEVCDVLNLEVEPTQPEMFLDRIITNIRCSLGTKQKEHVRSDAKTFLQNIRKENLHSGSAPISLAGAAVYCACKSNNVPTAQKEIADVTNTCAMTIRKRYQDIIDVSNIDRKDIVPEKLLD
jgi:transcription initiation factor TFIIB